MGKAYASENILATFKSFEGLLSETFIQMFVFKYLYSSAIPTQEVNYL